MKNEIECRFLEIDKEALIKKLISLGAKDKGEEMLEETIIYDQDLKWLEERRFLRLRKKGNKTILTYKEHREQKLGGAFETEFEVSDYKMAESLFAKIGLNVFRRQQKLRHSFVLNGVNFDIDTWPKIPTYVELEGESEAELRKAAQVVGLDWSKAEFHDAKWVIENIYKLPVGQMKSFTFDKVE